MRYFLSTWQDVGTEAEVELLQFHLLCWTCPVSSWYNLQHLSEVTPKPRPAVDAALTVVSSLNKAKEVPPTEKPKIVKIYLCDKIILLEVYTLGSIVGLYDKTFNHFHYLHQLIKHSWTTSVPPGSPTSVSWRSCDQHRLVPSQREVKENAKKTVGSASWEIMQLSSSGALTLI